MKDFGSSDQPPSQSLKELFDDEFVEVKKNDQFLPFSVDKILSDLIESGVSPYDALDVIYECRKFMKKRMNTRKLVKILNQALSDKGYSENEMLFGSYLQTIEIEFPDKEIKLFSFRVVKEMATGFLVNYSYSSKTYRAIVEELHRIVRTLRAPIIKYDTIEKMMPAVFRNTIGVNAFSRHRCVDDYVKAVKLHDTLATKLDQFPDSDKFDLMRKYFHSCYKVILLSYEYLPGTTLINTLHQIGVLVADLTKSGDTILSDKEIYVLGKSAKKIEDIILGTDKTGIDEDLLEAMDIIMTVVHGLMNRGSVLWLILTDISGNELYSKFGSTQSKRANRSLIAMAISGVQSILNELTDNRISQIESDEGSTIIFEKGEFFTILALVKQKNHLVRQRLQELALFVSNNLRNEIVNFMGNVNTIQKLIEEVVKDRFDNLID